MLILYKARSLSMFYQDYRNSCSGLGECQVAISSRFTFAFYSEIWGAIIATMNSQKWQWPQYNNSAIRDMYIVNKSYYYKPEDLYHIVVITIVLYFCDHNNHDGCELPLIWPNVFFQTSKIIESSLRATPLSTVYNHLYNMKGDLFRVLRITGRTSM